jgi:hypothetical protein
MVGTPDMSASLSGMKLKGLWKRVGEDIDEEAAYDNSGISIVMSSDGMRDAIGACSNAGNGWYSASMSGMNFKECGKGSVKTLAERQPMIVLAIVLRCRQTAK